MTIRRYLLLLPLLLVAWRPAAAEDVGDIDSVLEAYGRLGRIDIPPLTGEELQRLAAREPVVITRTKDADAENANGMGVTALSIIDRPRELIWLALMGATSEHDNRLTRIRLADGEAGGYTKYQHVDLPWPFRDRHWVIDIRKNIALAEATDGHVWEHHWQLADNGENLLYNALDKGVDPGIDRKTIENSTYLPANRGAWVTAPLGDSTTLVIARLEADFGGFIPKALVKDFTRKRMEKGLKKVEELTALVPERYDGSRLVTDGFGRPIPPLAQRPADTPLASAE